VMMLLEKDPANRFDTAASLVAALDAREAPPSRAPEPQPAPAASQTNARPNYPPALDRPSYGTVDRPSYPGADRPSYVTPERSSYPSFAQQGDRALQHQHPTSEELRRWEAPPVQAFRRKIAPYLFVNGVILVFAVFGQNGPMPVTVLWSIYIAFKYAKLWSEGYDWRDVFRQPRDREVMEVIEEAGEWLRAVFDPGARARLRANREQRKLAARMSPPMVGSGFESSPRGSGGAYPPLMDNALADRVRQAYADRDEIFMRMKSLGGALPSSQREEISQSAMALADKVQSLAMAMDEASRMDITSAREQLENEISALENAANPLERGSEDRVRRLAYLKRQRRALVDADTRRKSLASKLETCALALQSMRFDLMRLGASPQMHQHITGLANQAMSLADSVDEALYVADEMGRVGSRSTPNSRRSSERG